MFVVAAFLLLPPSPQAVLLNSCAYLRADPAGVGTAWVVNREKRLLLTCRHVVGDRTRVELFFPVRGRILRSDYLGDRDALTSSSHCVVGKVLRTSDAFDLALIEATAMPKETRALKLGAPPKPGLPVWAMGQRGDVETLWNLGSGHIRQAGKLSDGYLWETKKLLLESPGFALQMPIEAGDSGGPLVNYSGEVVGVLAATRPRGGFAIGPDATAIRAFLREPEPLPTPNPESHAARLIRSTVWVRPTATDVRTAGVIVVLDPPWVLTSAAGLGGAERVGVAFPVGGERDAYRDPVTLHRRGAWSPGRVVHRDTGRDLAVIELERLPKNAKALELAEVIEVGATVHAVSHPAGSEFCFAYAAGTVKQRGPIALVRDGAKVPALLLQLPGQASAAGGPVGDAHGRLIGVLAAKESPNGQVAYCADTNEARTFLKQARLAALVNPIVFVGHELTTREWLIRQTMLLFALVHLHYDRPREAVEEFDRVLLAEKHRRAALLGRAEALRALKKPKEALADVQRVLDVDPGDRGAHRLAAELWTDLGDTAKAQRHREAARALE